MMMLFAHNVLAFNVVIDPGHGGTDKGATRSIFQESLITLNLAHKIQTYLNEDISQIHSTLTRENDINLSLEQRVEIAQKQNADLFVSLHANSSPAKYVSGMEFYFKKGLNTDPAIDYVDMLRENKNFNISDQISEKQQDIVHKITTDLVDWGQTQRSLAFNKILQTNINLTKTTIKRAPFFVVENLATPSVLIEIGYISNLSESKKLLDDDYQNQIAQSIIKSIKDFKTEFYNSESK